LINDFPQDRNGKNLMIGREIIDSMVQKRDENN
jgi:hypothetical protein